MTTWIDGHLDLAYLAASGRDLTRPCPAGSDACISLPALRDAGVSLAFATIFTEPGGKAANRPESYPVGDAEAAHAAGVRQLEIYRVLEASGELSIVHGRRDLRNDAAPPRVVILMEGADPIRRPEEVPWWFEAGVRVVGLTWAAGTRYAGGNARHGPLTSQGAEMVRALDAAGIVHDVSHLADVALDGVLGCARGPIVASHSNCRALVEEDQRHLRDDTIAEIGRRGGIVGLNLCTRFLILSRRSHTGDCVAHIERVAEIMGHRRGVALGSDMDGGFGTQWLPEDLDHPTKLSNLAGALRASGWSDDDVRAFAHENWLRLLEQTLPSSEPRPSGSGRAFARPGRDPGPTRPTP